MERKKERKKGQTKDETQNPTHEIEDAGDEVAGKGEEGLEGGEDAV